MKSNRLCLTVRVDAHECSLKLSQSTLETSATEQVSLVLRRKHRISFFKSIHQHPHAFVQPAVRTVYDVDAVVSVSEVFQNWNQAARLRLFLYNKQRESDDTCVF